MEIRNRTPYVFARVMGRVNFPAHTASLVVKASFKLVPDGTCELLPVQAQFEGDVLSKAEVPESLYEADLGLFKPNAEVLLTGTCYTPANRPSTTCPATFRVGGWHKTIACIGNRVWKKSLLSAKAGEPEPFTQVALNWANAYGGNGFKDNPAGKGHKDEVLPNLEYPGELITGRGDHPYPACFGPIHRTWDARARKLGTYDKKWLKDRFPAFAADFDWTHFNAAPKDQQLPGFLRGDESIELENMHPSLPVLKTRLPGMRVRVLLREGPEGIAPESQKVREVPMNLDTLYVDADKGEVFVLWRGVANVTDDDWSEGREILIVHEPLSQNPRTIEQLLPEFIDPVDPEEAEQEEPDEEPVSAEQWRKDFDAEVAAEEAAVSKLSAQGERAAAAQAKSHGVDLNTAKAGTAGKPPSTSAQSWANVKEMLKTFGIAVPPAAEAAAVASASMANDPYVKAAMASLSDPDPVQQTDPGAIAAMMRSGEAQGGDFSGANLSGQDLKGADLRECLLQGCNFDGADLTGANLTEAMLTGSSLKAAKLDGANLTEAELSGTNFEAASLKGAKLGEVTLQMATLKGANLEGAEAESASLLETISDGASFKGAKLKDATFSNSQLAGADFSGADLTDAAMDGVKAAGAKFDGAKLQGFRGGEKSDFSKGSFKGVEGPECVFERSNLTGADFNGANMPRAQFSGSNLSDANLFGCELRESLFLKTDLRAVKGGNANFFRAVLEGANLGKASMVASNFYEAEFMDAKTDGADFGGANLKMTKLSNQ